MTNADFPEFKELGIPAVRLLQGALYEEDETAWQVLLSNESDLTTYFARLGLVLVIDRGEGLAYLSQLGDDQRTGGYERLPRLFRRAPLSYAQTLLCVLLRDEYRRFEDEDLDNERCIVELIALLDAWNSFFPGTSDEVQQRRKLIAQLNKLADLGFVRKVGANDETWEILKLLKARLPLDLLENVREQLLKAEKE